MNLCNLTITQPLSVIYKNCLQQGVFPDDWKKGNIIPVHKKDRNQIVDYCRPVSLLPICSKIFEKLIFDSIYDLINKNNLFNNNKSRFRSSDSCIQQRIAITHNIFSAFVANPSLEVRGVFLDLSKAFDRVWHDDLLYNLKSNGTDSSLFKLIKSFLNKRCQRVVLNGLSSVWKSVTAGVAQGSILGPLFSHLH